MRLKSAHENAEFLTILSPLTMALIPCQCRNLQRGIKILAVIDAVVGTLFLASFLLNLIKLEIERRRGNTYSDAGVRKSLYFSSLVISAYLLFTFQLWYGVIAKDIGICKTWILGAISITLIYVIVVGSLRYGDLRRGGVDKLAIASAFPLFKVCEIVAVTAFIRELKVSLVAQQRRQYNANQMDLLISANDLSPYCPETQNEPVCVETLLLHRVQGISPVKRNALTRIIPADLPPSYLETINQSEFVESSPPLYEEAIILSQRKHDSV